MYAVELTFESDHASLEQLRESARQYGVAAGGLQHVWAGTRDTLSYVVLFLMAEDAAGAQRTAIAVGDALARTLPANRFQGCRLW